MVQRSRPMRSRASRCVCALLVPFASQACSDRRPDEVWSGTVRDSADVRIVENPSAGVWTAGEAWTVTEELRIGSLEGRGAYQFGSITALAVDEDGRIWVADSQAREVRVFDAEGGHQRTLGRPGSGPGELGQALPGVFVRDGATLVVDVMNQRVNVYPAEAEEEVASFRLDFSRGIPIRFDMDASRRLLAQLRSLPVPGGTASASPAAAGDPIVALDDGGVPTDTLLVLPPGESLTLTGGLPRLRIFESEPIWDASPDGRLITARSNDYRIEERGPDGALRRILTRPFARRPVTEGDRERLLAQLRSTFTNQGVPPAAAEQLLSQTQFADHYPAFATVMAGPRGSTWVQGIRTAADLEGTGEFNPQDLGSRDWDVLDAEGRYLGVVRLPSRTQPMVFEGDLLYAVTRDELDIPAVVRLRVDVP